jgi:hypothetical protein
LLPCLILSLALTALTTPVYADRDQTEQWTLNLYFENDLFSETDQDYTNGIRFSWVSPDLADYIEDENLPDWLKNTNRRLTFFHPSDEGLQRNVIISLGQTIYTPQDIDATEVIEDDRPYAGWLYSSVSYQSKTANQLDTLELQIGVVGPAALGQEAQDLIHDLRGFAKFQGWDNQLDNELGVLALYEHKRKYKSLQNKNSRFGYDWIGHAGLALGNVGSYVNAGAEFRVGWLIPNDFGTSAVRPGGDNSAPDVVWDPRTHGDRSWGLHGFASFDVRLVGRDIFLDGNTFENSHSVDKELLVADLSAGISVIYHGVKMSYAQVFRTREFKKQKRSHSYGSLSLSYTF